MPKVSVIIPTYNRASFLKEAIDSVFNQTYKDFELIIIDDGSNDNTREVINSYPVIYEYQANKGVSSARNNGLKLAKGEYIAFLDSDDLWKKDKLKIQVNFMEKNGCQVSYTDEIWIRNGLRVNPKKKHQKYSGWIFDKVLPLCIVSPSSCMLRREVFDKVGYFDENLPACEDYDFWIRVAKKYKICLIEEKLIIKRGGHSDQLSKTIWGLDRFRVIALEKAIKNGLSWEQKNLVIKELKRKCKILVNGCLKRGKNEEAKFYQSISQKYKTE